MDWLAGDQDMAEYETSLVTGAEVLLLGRVTFGDFAATWPRIARDEAEPLENRAYALRVDSMPKLVVSRRGEIADWGEARRIESLDRQTMMTIKNAGAGVLLIYGSLSVVARLQEMDMIDEYHLLVHPTAIGAGKPLFSRSNSPVSLRLLAAVPFASGVVLTRYVPAR